MVRIVLALFLISPLGGLAQAQPNPDMASSALAHFMDIKLACPQVETTDVAAVAECAEKTCGRDDIADKTRAQGCGYLAMAEGRHSHWAQAAADAFNGLVYLSVTDFPATALRYAISRLEVLQARSDAEDASADVQRRGTAERAVTALGDAILKNPAAAKYLQDPSLWMNGVLDWDYTAAAYAFRGIGRMDAGDLAGAIEDYYSARVKTVHCGHDLVIEVMDPGIVLAELARRIQENPGSSPTDLTAGANERIQKELHIRYPCPRPSWLDPEGPKDRCCR